MQKIISIISALIFSLGLAFYSFAPKVSADEYSNTAKVIITEIKLGGGDDVVFADGSKAKDFVTLYNQSSEPVALEGWSLQYAKVGPGMSDCDTQFGSASTTVLSGTLLPGAASTPIKRSMNDGTDGTLRLIDSNGLVNDLIGWGSTTKCYDTSPAPTPANGKSLQRYIDCESNTPIDTDNNSADFAVSDTPGPGTLTGPVTTDCSDPEPPPGDGNGNGDDTGNDGNDTGGMGSGAAGSCDGVIISELLANPAGSDTGHEFIELHNPTDAAISLAGCKLQTTAGPDMYEFGDILLASGKYEAFYNDTTGLTLPNSAGGSVYLVSPDESTDLDQADYPADLDDDVSWSLISGSWKKTFDVTPNAANVLMALKSCPAGQFRNRDTNRCDSIVSEAAGLGPCPAGKQRNPDTHRCRNIDLLASVLEACASDQYRNPATNRCKKYESASSLKPCGANQYRNPSTNRCRNKAASSGSINDVKDVLSATTGQENKSNWAIAVISIFGALGYGLWEWRGEILQMLSGLKSDFSFK